MESAPYLALFFFWNIAQFHAISIISVEFRPYFNKISLTNQLSPLPFQQNVVAVVMIVVRWAIPDMSAELRDKIRRESYITNEIIIKQEAERARRLANGKFLNILLAHNKIIKSCLPILLRRIFQLLLGRI